MLVDAKGRGIGEILYDLGVEMMCGSDGNAFECLECGEVWSEELGPNGQHLKKAVICPNRCNRKAFINEYGAID